jgi:polyisoprenoid-binding protein YceI
MKNYFHTGFITAVLLLALSNQALLSQQSITLIPDQSHIIIKGTSTVHDWEESAEKFNVSLNFKFSEKEITGISKAQVIVKSKSITSDNSIMTNKTHDALKVEQYPDIEFKLVSVDKISSASGQFSGTVVGDITLAGVTKRISLAFTGQHNGSKISIKGSKDLNMSDFKIKPPTAMLGTLKTGEQVTVSFQLNFQIT